jgi:hypothetical protein
VLVFDWSDKGASCDLFTGRADTRDTVVITQVNNGSEQYQPGPYDVLHYVPQGIVAEGSLVCYACGEFEESIYAN